jgi:hypothetical protein
MSLPVRRAFTIRGSAGLDSFLLKFTRDTGGSAHLLGIDLVGRGLVGLSWHEEGLPGNGWLILA